MSWISVVSTVAGTVIALSSALVIEPEYEQHAAQVLQALTRMRDAMRADMGTDAMN